MTQQEYNIHTIIKFLSELQTLLNEITPSKKAAVNKNEQPSERRSVEKRPSWWVRVREKLTKICKVKNEATKHASDSDDSQGESKRSRRYIDEDQEDLHLEIRKLHSDVIQMISTLKNLTEFQTNMSKSLEFLRSTKLRAILQKTDSIKSRAHNLKDLRRKISALKCQIPSSFYKQSSKVLSITESLTAEEFNEIDETGIDIYLPGIHVSEDFKNSLAFEEVLEKFQSLDFTQKLCLLSFSVFPENRKVERTMLMYWWIGEGFINCDVSEYSVTRILHEFSAKGLLEPVENEKKLNPSCYKMEHHVHSAVIYLAKYVNLFELYNPKGNLIMKKSLKKKVCLVKGSSLLKEAKASAMKPKTLQTVFNSSERLPEFTFKWFPLMNSLRVLYLGRWERSAARHIEFVSTEFLKDIKYLKNLRLASFQGIAGIENINNSICKLKKLVILDLRACYHLEVLPDNIGLLENLVYLDASECLKLDRMPKGIADLSRLQVLKGFVISQSDDEENCAVKHLVNLRKLSITVKNNRFKVENLMESLRGLKHLESLKIAWRVRFHEDDRRGEETNEPKVYREITNEEKVIEGDAKTSPPQESKDTIQTKPNDHREISKVQENGDGEKNGDDLKKLNGGEAKTQKSDKTIKFSKKVGFSENSKAMIQKKPNDLKRDNAIARRAKLFKAMDNEINIWGIRWLEIDDTSKLPSSLKKLKLEAYPEKNPPSWLNPISLDNLEKLCIEGGKLSRISDESPSAENQWPVKILRLKYLHEFKVEWSGLQALFPQMILLEKYKCPKVTFCPTDGNGVWRR